MRILGAGYANAALAASALILTKDGAGGAAIAAASSDKRIRIAAHGNGVFVRLGIGAPAAATAGTAGELLVPAAETLIVNMGTEWEWMAIINAGAGCMASAHPVELEDGD